MGQVMRLPQYRVSQERERAKKGKMKGERSGNGRGG